MTTLMITCHKTRLALQVSGWVGRDKAALLEFLSRDLILPLIPLLTLWRSKNDTGTKLAQISLAWDILCLEEWKHLSSIKFAKKKKKMLLGAKLKRGNSLWVMKLLPLRGPLWVAAAINLLSPSPSQVQRDERQAEFCTAYWDKDFAWVEAVWNCSLH